MEVGDALGEASEAKGIPELNYLPQTYEKSATTKGAKKEAPDARLSAHVKGLDCDTSGGSLHSDRFRRVSSSYSRW